MGQSTVALAVFISNLECLNMDFSIEHLNIEFSLSDTHSHACGYLLPKSVAVNLDNTSN